MTSGEQAVSGEHVVQSLPWKWNVQGRIFIIGGLGYMFDAWDVVLNGFLTPLVGDYWDLDLGTRALVATANLIGMAIGAVVWGSIADKVGRKKAFSITVLIFAVFSVIGAFSVNFEMFILLRFLAGFGLGGAIPVDYALVSEFSPRRLRGRILAAMDVWWPIGGTVCGLVATLLVPLEADMRWRWMLVFMVLPALLLFWVRRGVPESPIYLARTGQVEKARAVIDGMVEATGAAKVDYTIAQPIPTTKMSWRVVASTLGEVWRFSPRITATSWALFVAIMLLYYAVLTWMPSILRKQGHGDTAAFAGTTLMTAVGIVGVLCSAWLCEAYGRKWVIGVSAPLAGVAVVLFAATINVGTISLVFLCIFGFMIQVAIPVLYAYVSELYPTRIRASGFGWASAVSRAATGFAPLIFGTLLWPRVGLTATFAIACALVVGAVFLMMFGSPETKGRELDDIGDTRSPTPTAAH